jgi:hypothetical protein
MSDRSRSATTPRLGLLYGSLVALGSIVAHLAAEFFAMGSDADSVALSPRHLYLGVIALICLVIVISQCLALWRKSSGVRDLKRALHVGLASLPFRGRGTRFFALTAALQLGAGLGTQIGEGCPFCGHDVAAGVLGALLTAVLLALAGRAIAWRLPSIAAAIAALFVDEPSLDPSRIAFREIALLGLPRFAWFSQLYNRPPPLLSTTP